LIGHQFSFHNELHLPYEAPVSLDLPVAQLLFDHCLPQSLSFVIEDRQRIEDQANEREKDTEPATERKAQEENDREKEKGRDLPSDSVFDHDRHATAMRSQTIVGVMLNFDEAHSVDFDQFCELNEWCHEQMALWRAIEKPECDERSEDEKEMVSQMCRQSGRVAHVWYIAVDCEYNGRGLSRALCRAFYDEARRLGFGHACVEVSHEATMRLFMTEPFFGTITHRFTTARIEKFAHLSGDTVKIGIDLTRI